MIIVIILCPVILITVYVFRFIKRKAKEYSIKWLKEYSRKSNYERMMDSFELEQKAIILRTLIDLVFR